MFSHGLEGARLTQKRRTGLGKLKEMWGKHRRDVPAAKIHRRVLAWQVYAASPGKSDEFRVLTM
jgi:hypothetical protein